jgi:hypothetical protein
MKHGMREFGDDEKDERDRQRILPGSGGGNSMPVKQTDDRNGRKTDKQIEREQKERIKLH